MRISVLCWRHSYHHFPSEIDAQEYIPSVMRLVIDCLDILEARTAASHQPIMAETNVINFSLFMPPLSNWPGILPLLGEA